MRNEECNPKKSWRKKESLEHQMHYVELCFCIDTRENMKGRGSASQAERELTWLEFPLHLPSLQPHQDSFRVRFLFAVYIAWPLSLVALSSSVGNMVAPDRVRSLWWNMDTKLGGSQPRAEPVGRLSRARTSHCHVTLSDFFTVKSDEKKGNNSRNVSPVTSRRSRDTSPAMSRRSSVVSWSDSPRDQAVPKSEDAVMGDCTESHQAEINRKIRANDKLRKNSHRTCQMNTNRSSTVTVSRKKCSRWM